MQCLFCLEKFDRIFSKYRIILLLRLLISKFLDFIWELWCIVSFIGIWPRHIEPRLLSITRKKLCFSKGNKELEGLKVVHFTDLHFSSKTSSRFLKKITKKIDLFSPDIIVFTGDFLSYSRLQNPSVFKAFFQSLKAPLGCYYVSGNHDYSEYVTRENGNYITITYESAKVPVLTKLAQRLRIIKQSGVNKLESSSLKEHLEMKLLLQDAGWTSLENRSIQVYKGNGGINISGMGDLWSGRFKPEKSFEKYQHGLPGIVLSHNPLTFKELSKWPGDVVLSGHTHGGQVNLPILKRLFYNKDPQVYRRGVYSLSNKFLFVSRGVGTPLNFRWFSSPELIFFTVGDKS